MHLRTVTLYSRRPELVVLRLAEPETRHSVQVDSNYEALAGRRILPLDQKLERRIVWLDPDVEHVHRGVCEFGVFPADTLIKGVPEISNRGLKSVERVLTRELGKAQRGDRVC